MRPVAPDAVVAGERRVATAASMLALGLVLWPIRQNWRAAKRDGFPLSYYPMFSARRSERVQVHHLVAVTAPGERRLLAHHLCGPGGLNQVRRQLRRLMRAGQAEQLCERVVQRLARERDGSLADVVSVEAVRSEYSLADYFGGDKRPLSEKVYASLAVEGRA